MSDLAPEPVRSIRFCDAVYATVVIDQRGYAAVLYWARNRTSGVPLALVDWDLRPFRPDLWGIVADRLEAMAVECRARFGSLGIWTESLLLARQAEMREQPVLMIPDHLTDAKAWDALSLTATLHVHDGSVKVMEAAYRRTREAKFGALAWMGGDRPDDPTVPAFLYGIVLGLDEASARDPKPRPLQRTNKG